MYHGKRERLIRFVTLMGERERRWRHETNICSIYRYVVHKNPPHPLPALSHAWSVYNDLFLPLEAFGWAVQPEFVLFVAAAREDSAVCLDEEWPVWSRTYTTYTVAPPSVYSLRCGEIIFGTKSKTACICETIKIICWSNISLRYNAYILAYFINYPRTHQMYYIHTKYVVCYVIFTNCMNIT